MEDIKEVRDRYEELFEDPFSFYSDTFDKARPILKRGKNKNGDVAHTLYVFSSMMEILKVETSSTTDIKIGLTAALLHDIGYGLLVMAGKEVSELSTQESRREHMTKGAGYARQNLGASGLSVEEIERVAYLISIHDNPSVFEEGRGIPLDINDSMSFMLREADRLWMMSPEGFSDDMEKSGLSADDYLGHVIKRYHEERHLYTEDGKFLCGFFRTNKAYSIFLKHLKDIVFKYDVQHVPECDRGPK